MKLISKFLYLSLLILTSCSFQKNSKSDSNRGSDQQLHQETAKTENFCDDNQSQNSLTSTTLLALSTSDQPKDLCIVWNQVKNFQENDIEDDNIEVVENFSLSALNLVSKGDKPFTYYNQFAKELTNLSLVLNGSSIKNVIVINNLTHNSNNNLVLIPYLKENIDWLFSSTNDLTSNQFSEYWKSVEEAFSKESLCSDSMINKIIQKKTISSHLLTISSSCKVKLNSGQVVEARSKLEIPVSENELRYFRNALKSQTILIESEKKLKLRTVLLIAIANQDANLFRMTIGIPKDESVTYILTLAYITQSKIEPFLEKVNSNDLSEALEWSDFSQGMGKKGFKEVLDLFYKYNIFPTEKHTLSYLLEITTTRIQYPDHYSNSLIVDLFRYLKSNTATKLGSAIQFSEFIQQELGLIFKGKVDPSVIEFLVGKEMKDISVTFVNSLLSFNKFIFSLDKSPGTYRIQGTIFVAIGKKSNLKELSTREILYFVKEDGTQGFHVEMDDFLKSMDSGNFNEINLVCQGSDCGTLVPIYVAGTRSLLARIAASYKSIIAE
ncbi:hypothetical protein ACLSU7_10010 [Bdellovibrio sp. HCB185ZH]|uniref:hypothetical protein n=1 Tax=Bdellovibrio sp. HCB185ZH TaxID=3394235 RepID=UPI0039A57B99